MTYLFTHTLPLNKKKIRLACLSMLSVIMICAIGVTLSLLYWDKYTHEVFSFKLGRNVLKGWPVTIYSWGLWMGILFIIVLPIVFFMQDLKNPSLGITHENLFINQQMIRNALIPISNIEKIEKSETGYVIQFKDNQAVLSHAGIFKAFIKYNLENGGFSIDDENTHETHAFFTELNSLCQKK